MSPTWEYQSIPIDFDVFKQMTAELESPEDSFNDVLRRKYGLPAARRTAAATGATRPWIVDGVTFPHGTELRRTFKGREYTARVENGALVYDGTRYDTPSAAAMAITRGVAANGWRFWNARRPGDSGFQRINRIRRALRAGRA